MGFEAHKNRRLWPANVYSYPDQPHHVHKANGCTDHREGSCPESHWIGGRPEAAHPHHVEFDGKTGRWGYMRLSEEELADLEHLHALEVEQYEAFERSRAAGHDLIRERAKEDPAFAALARQMGIALS